MKPLKNDIPISSRLTIDKLFDDVLKSENETNGMLVYGSIKKCNEKKLPQIYKGALTSYDVTVKMDLFQT